MGDQQYSLGKPAETLEDSIHVSNIRVGDTQSRLERTPSDPILLPITQGGVEVDRNVIKGVPIHDYTPHGKLADIRLDVALPIPGSTLLHSQQLGESLWGETAKLTVKLPDGTSKDYFLKVVPKLGSIGKQMCHGEFESLTAIDNASPGFAPKPYAWGQIAGEEDSYFLLAEFRHIACQPAEPTKLARRLAEMHMHSLSPTGKFGFHIFTCHAKVIQAVDVWDDSWCLIFGRHLGHIIDLASPVLEWPEFDIMSRLVLNKVVPRLLLPLQSDGRVLKPSLVHGDCWDGNTAMDMKSGEAFIFDVYSFYGHNEYDTGNWRAPRHRLSNRAYMENYKLHFPPSEPVEDWDARNLLYSLPFNLGNAIFVPGSSQRQLVYEDMTTLCELFCPDALRQRMELSREV
ncbi:Fructosamine kinase-domain-containing protein [Triangularia verruculosa]|uniref:protein-ribulosamine 3-kinase n=1 Tax=Triangularia verruculosa TaxID=2587418 RepID=A0AAN6XRB4_9PEZI|nr:Fructosamine kinase-domain-containing protein [Triangularia verruculosa]